jgi:hypothetical protein
MKRELMKVAFAAACLALAAIGAHSDGLLPDYLAPLEVAAAAVMTSIAGGAILAALLIRRHARAA